MRIPVRKKEIKSRSRIIFLKDELEESYGIGEIPGTVDRKCTAGGHWKIVNKARFFL